MNNSNRLISDEELLRLARECRSNSALNELIKRYTFYSKSLSFKYDDASKTGITREEVEQIALISFYCAYRKVKLNTHGFYLYWEKTAKRDIRNHYAKHSYLEGGQSFAGPSFDENVNDDCLLSDYLGEEDEKIKKELLINDMLLAIHKKGSDLTSKERAVIKLFLKSKSFDQIAKELGISNSYVYLLFNSATKKLRKYLD